MKIIPYCSKEHVSTNIHSVPHHHSISKQASLVQNSRSACRSSHSMCSVVCILISHESQSCHSFNKLPLLQLPQCFSSAHSKENTVKCAAGLLDWLKKKHVAINKNRNAFFFNCQHSLPPNEKFWLTHCQRKPNINYNMKRLL